MKEFIDKLIERLEEESNNAEAEMHILADSEYSLPCQFDRIDIEDCKSKTFCEAIQIVNQLAEEYRQDLDKNSQGWISVSERLPSKSGKYLVTAKNITGWWIMENNVFVCDYAYDTFIFQGWEDNEVIAWCELPAPYTEGE